MNRSSLKAYLAIMSYLCSLPSAWFVAAAARRERKVGTTQGAILPNGKGIPGKPGFTESATENNRPDLVGIRVKTRGKSPRLRMVTF